MDTNKANKISHIIGHINCLEEEIKEWKKIPFIEEILVKNGMNTHWVHSKDIRQRVKDFITSELEKDLKQSLKELEAL